MAYFVDLSPYEYLGQKEPHTLNVGWLDALQGFTKGRCEPWVIPALDELASNPVRQTRGYHFCNLCGVWGRLRCSKAARQSSAEIRISDGKSTFASPVMICHYVRAHHYLPPEEFITALKAHAHLA